MPSEETVRRVLSNPLSWVAGIIMSLLGVAASLGVDPITGGIIVATVVWNNAMTMFTATTILGFTIGPELDFLNAKPFQAAAIILGFIVVGQTVDKVWGRIKTRVR